MIRNIGTNLMKSSSSILLRNQQNNIGLFKNFTSISEAVAAKVTSEESYNSKNQFTPIGKESFAVVHISGKQYKVIEGDIIMTDKIQVDVGEHIVLDKVLLVGTKNETIIGKPIISNFKVHAYIEEQAKTEHVTIYKHKPRKNYKRTTGFQGLATYIRIGGIIKGQETTTN
ncbi:hypothetical protein ACTFIY_001983 [Dictyostelium cf. discoideum]